MIFSTFLYAQAAQYPSFSITQSVTELSSKQLSNLGDVDSLCKRNLSGLTDINVADMSKVDAFLAKLFRENRTLCSLVRINASNTDITLQTLKLLRMIKVDPCLFRDLPQYSGRFGCSVAPIYVNIAGTDLSKSKELEYSVIEQPAGECYPVCYRSNNIPSELATVQVIIER